MPNFKIIVHCGRGKKDWLIVTQASGLSYFNGFGLKKHATRFVSEAQARGAAQMHCFKHMYKGYNGYKLFRVEDK